MKILVRAPNWIGDAVMAIPALEAVRRARPRDQICVLARPAITDLFAGQPFADAMLSHEFRGRHRGWLGRAKLVHELQKEKFDMALLLQNAFEAAWIAWRARIPERIGYARDARSLLLTKAVPAPRENEIPRHEANYYLELVRRSGWVDARPEVRGARLAISVEERAAAESALRRAGVRENSWRCAIAPGASYGAAKCWPPERFSQLADRLVSEFGADVLFFGSPGEKEISDRIRSKMKSHAVSLVGETSVREFAARLSSCSLFIGNDSGAMHVAAAVGMPVIGIFGPTDPEGTAPLADQFTLVRQPVSCSPCFLRRCPVDHRCMARISVDSVFEAAARVKSASKGLPIWSAGSV
jgi:heptosyltransferase II